MSLNTFKAGVRTVYSKPDFALIAQGVAHLEACGFSPREIYRAALSVDPDLNPDTWADTVATAKERHPAK